MRGLVFLTPFLLVGSAIGFGSAYLARRAGTEARRFQGWERLEVRATSDSWCEASRTGSSSVTHCYLKINFPGEGGKRVYERMGLELGSEFRKGDELVVRRAPRELRSDPYTPEFRAEVDIDRDLANEGPAVRRGLLGGGLLLVGALGSLVFGGRSPEPTPGSPGGPEA